MTSIQTSPLAENLPFGTRITGVNWDNVEKANLRTQIKAIFEDRGLIIFEDVEPCDKMLVALSNIIGPLQDLSLEKVSRVDGDIMPGVLRFKNEPGDDNVFEIDGKIVSGWLSWHFDACYTGVLSRGGVLRVVDNPPEGGLT